MIYILHTCHYSYVQGRLGRQHTRTEQSVGCYIVRFLVYLQRGNLACSRVKTKMCGLHELRLRMQIFGRLTRTWRSEKRISKGKYAKAGLLMVLNTRNDVLLWFVWFIYFLLWKISNVYKSRD